MNLDTLKTFLRYEPDTGNFYWLIDRWKMRVGKKAGTIGHGYLYITVHGEKFAAHRLAWLFTHGVWPTNHIDHIDGVKLNNRIANLRDVTRSMNQQNRRGASVANKSTGILGVTFSKRDHRYIAHITVNNKSISLGYFRFAEDAANAYNEAKIIRDRCESLETYHAKGREELDNASRGNWLSLGEETMCQADCERRLHLSSGALRRRLNRGWSLEKALSTPRFSSGRPLKPGS